MVGIVALWKSEKSSSGGAAGLWNSGKSNERGSKLDEFAFRKLELIEFLKRASKSTFRGSITLTLVLDGANFGSIRTGGMGKSTSSSDTDALEAKFKPKSSLLRSGIAKETSISDLRGFGGARVGKLFFNDSTFNGVLRNALFGCFELAASFSGFTCRGTEFEGTGVKPLNTILCADFTSFLVLRLIAGLATVILRKL